MPSINLHIKYSKNLEDIFTPRDIYDMYFYGIDTRAKDGSVIPDHVIIGYIRSAQQEIEKYLGIKLIRQIVEEDHHYHGSDWRSWSIIQTAYPVEEPVQLAGYYGQIKHIVVPSQWLTSKKSSDELYHRSVWLLPNGVGMYQQVPLVTTGITPMVSRDSTQTIPNYWKLRYVTGFKKVPMDLYNVIGKLAAINVFNVLGDLILGSGIASQSIGIDGLSQSVSTVLSADSSGYGARIKMYSKDLTDTLPRIKEHYTGIKFTCV